MARSRSAEEQGMTDDQMEEWEKMVRKESREKANIELRIFAGWLIILFVVVGIWKFWGA